MHLRRAATPEFKKSDSSPDAARMPEAGVGERWGRKKKALVRAARFHNDEPLLSGSREATKKAAMCQNAHPNVRIGGCAR